MKKNVGLFALFFSLFAVVSCNSGENEKSEENVTENNIPFRVVGYYVPMPRGMTSVSSIQYEYLTSINYSFAKPDISGDGSLEPFQEPWHSKDTLRSLVKTAHEKGVEVFISIGGFDIGDGPGIDTRFEILGSKEETRRNFAHSVMNMVREFDLDGADLDWEFPDPEEPSLSNFVSLMKVLADSLHPSGKKLTAAIESHRLPYTYGVDDRVFEIADWLNIMVYDGEEIGWHRPNPQTSHSPYWLAVESLDYWLDKRGLPKDKTVLGVPFYGKGLNRAYYNYRKLLAMGADPFADVYDETIQYNGIKTMKKKVKLAQERGSGIMIWEISGDTTGKYSLLKTIHDATHGDE